MTKAAWCEYRKGTKEMRHMDKIINESLLYEMYGDMVVFIKFSTKFDTQSMSHLTHEI